MNTTTVFATGALATLAIGWGVVWYLRRPRKKILVCGNEERAAFWAAFSAEH